MKTLTNSVMTLMIITLAIFSSHAQVRYAKQAAASNNTQSNKRMVRDYRTQGKKTIKGKRELKKINRIYKLSPNYQNTSAILKSSGILKDGGEVREDQSYGSCTGNTKVKRTLIKKNIGRGTLPTKKLRKTFIDTYLVNGNNQKPEEASASTARRTQVQQFDNRGTGYNSGSMGVMTAPIPKRRKSKFGDIHDGSSNTIKAKQTKGKE